MQAQILTVDKYYQLYTQGTISIFLKVIINMLYACRRLCSIVVG